MAAETDGIIALIEGPEGLFFRSGHVKMSPDSHTVTVAVDVLPPFDPDALDAADIGITLVTPAGSAFETLELGRGVAPASAGMSLGFAFVLALLGGMILNLMPCVLPVLGIKVARLVDAAGRDASSVSLSFLASAAGIIASFLALALLVAAIRATGTAVGWGFQFHVPGFIAFLVVVVLLFAGILAGVSSIHLPRRIGQWLQTTDTRSAGYSGAFAEGAFATLLATPCTAPVVGTAVSFALSRGVLEIVLLFIGLGLGMASPWLCLAAQPRLLAFLPKPGRWMNGVKLVLALMLVGTAVWLLSVLYATSGLAATTAVVTLSGLVLLAFSVMPFGRRTAWIRAGGVGAMVLAVAVPALVGTRPAAHATAPDDMVWHRLEPAALRTLARDQVVLVDVTADWCVTCIVNKRLVLDRSPVRDLFESGDVLAVRGNWTLPDPEIAAFLAAQNRFGIPFNAVYGPGQPGGEILPTLLDADTVLEAIDRAKGTAIR